ncbi:Mitochondrial import inner membrane translocase subunit TIM10 [Spatholobus suberectus]|nr:Mitochondrial import inner membrane translocase subunit TIM10 [Spatholobus suberectus]
MKIKFNATPEEGRKVGLMAGDDVTNGEGVRCGLASSRSLSSRLQSLSPAITPRSPVTPSLLGDFQGTMAANNISPSAFDKEQIFGMAEKEMEYRVELFNKMTQTCFNKCVDNRYKESELNMGENSCIDRCVSKYWHVTNLIGQLLGSGRPPM